MGGSVGVFLRKDRIGCLHCNGLDRIGLHWIAIGPGIPGIVIVVEMDCYDFDSFLRYDDLTAWLGNKEQQFPNLIELTSYGKSHEGRDLWLITVTDTTTGKASDKPAHWVDANIHSTEVASGVAACFLIQHLVNEFEANNELVVEALRTRTFYVAPRVNPDGVEAALGDSPRYLRSSVRPWPWKGHRWPGLLPSDIDGDGEVLGMRVRDPHGAWVAHPRDARVMIPVDHRDSPLCPLPPVSCNSTLEAGGSDAVVRLEQPLPRSGVQRYRLLQEGLVENYDGFTIPTPANQAALDLNRNWPAWWGKNVTGSGEHALSEPEIYYLVRALAARPNICGYNAYHTNGGVLLRPHSCKMDSDLSPVDVWVWKEMGAVGTALTGNPSHSCFEDFTFDRKEPMSGASDDFMYDHVGVFSWTTEFWDPVFAATGHRASPKLWYLGPTVEEELAIAAWADQNAPELYVAWREFEHPQLGTVELGGPNHFKLLTNPPPHLLKKEVAPHADFAIYQAMLSPKLEIVMCKCEHVGSHTSGFIWRIAIGVANTGFLPTNVTEKALEIKAVLPITVEITSAVEGALRSMDGYSPLRVALPGSGQLSGRLSSRVEWSGCDGTPDRDLTTFTVIARPGESITAIATHPRAGTARHTITLPALVA